MTGVRESVTAFVQLQVRPLAKDAPRVDQLVMLGTLVMRVGDWKHKRTNWVDINSESTDRASPRSAGTAL